LGIKIRQILVLPETVVQTHAQPQGESDGGEYNGNPDLTLAQPGFS
jgi:hypothetical protein